MDGGAFQKLQDALDQGGAPAVFETLIATCREAKSYPALFEALLMSKRHELGLPLIQTGEPYDIPAEARPAYETAFLEAAREVGSLYLGQGDIAPAWRYFRAIGDSAPVAAAIEAIKQSDSMDEVIAVALQERVNPRKGFELALQHFGICRAITLFEQYPDGETRPKCLELLVRTLHGELLDNLKRTVERQEGSAPDTSSIRELIAGRDWLFGPYDYYVDTSHLISVLRYSLDAEDAQILALAVDMTWYGERLSSNFQFRPDPPFDDVYSDHRVYLRALMGEDADAAVEHFRSKLASGDYGSIQAFVRLLLRLERYKDAIDAVEEHLKEVDPRQLGLPSLIQLYELAGDPAALMEYARAHDDLLHFAAAALSAAPQRVT